MPSSPPSTSRLAPRPRLTLLDALRILASVAIVRYHVVGDPLFGVGFGMPLFLVIMFALAASSTSRETLGSFARRKSAYLLAPWVRWSLLCLAVAGAQDLVWGGSLFERYSWRALLYGGHIYYWFLPFAAASIVVVRVLQPRLRKLDARAAVLLFATGGALLAPLCARALSAEPLPPPYPGWLGSLPALGYGLALGHVLRVTRPRERLLLLVTIAGIAVGSAYLVAGPDGLVGVPRRYAAAVPLACIGFAWRPRMPRVVASVATTTFGIYLVHPLTILALRQVVDITRWPAAGQVAGVWFASSLLILGLRRLRPAWSEVGRPLAPTPLHRLEENEGQSRAA